MQGILVFVFSKTSIIVYCYEEGTFLSFKGTTFNDRDFNHCGVFIRRIMGYVGGSNWEFYGVQCNYITFNKLMHNVFYGLWLE